MFDPKFTISAELANSLMAIEQCRTRMQGLPITPRLLKSLRETARVKSTHYSTMVEGNRLTQQQVLEVLFSGKKVPGKDRDEKEVLGYYAALSFVEKQGKKRDDFSQEEIQTIHALVMAAGKTKTKPTPYREGQNVIREGATGAIVYLPPQAEDVPSLMADLVTWLNSAVQELPIPLLVAIAHYQFATIHPYYDGNGRTARLLATLIAHRFGYDLNGIYSLDEYYAKDLASYYQALSIGPSHNYYLGRADADISSWVNYFIAGMKQSFETIVSQAEKVQAAGALDRKEFLAELDVRQRKALDLFCTTSSITSKEIESYLKLTPRTARALCQQWVKDGFLIVTEQAKKSRRYELAPLYRILLKDRIG